MADFYTIVTNNALAKLTRAKADNTPITLSTMAVGDSEETISADTVDIQSKKHTFNIISLAQDINDENILIAQGSIPADVGGFYIRQVAVYDADNELFAVGIVPPTYKSLISEGAPKDILIKFVMQISNDLSVNIQIPANQALATSEALNTGLSLKADISSVYSKAEADTKFATAQTVRALIVDNQKDTISTYSSDKIEKIALHYAKDTLNNGRYEFGKIFTNENGAIGQFFYIFSIKPRDEFKDTLSERFFLVVTRNPSSTNFLSALNISNNSSKINGDVIEISPYINPNQEINTTSLEVKDIYTVSTNVIIWHFKNGNVLLQNLSATFKGSGDTEEYPKTQFLDKNIKKIFTAFLSTNENYYRVDIVPVFLVDEDNNIYAIGNGSKGALFNRSTSALTSFTKINNPYTSSPVKQILSRYIPYTDTTYSNTSHTATTLILYDDGTVYVAGEGYAGITGGNTSSETTPRRLSVEPVEELAWASPAPYTYGSLALHFKSGKLAVMGYTPTFGGSSSQSTPFYLQNNGAHVTNVVKIVDCFQGIFSRTGSSDSQHSIQTGYEKIFYITNEAGNFKLNVWGSQFYNGTSNITTNGSKAELQTISFNDVSLENIGILRSRQHGHANMAIIYNKNPESPVHEQIAITGVNINVATRLGHLQAVNDFGGITFAFNPRPTSTQMLQGVKIIPADSTAYRFLDGFGFLCISSPNGTDKPQLIYYHVELINQTGQYAKIRSFILNTGDYLR